MKERRAGAMMGAPRGCPGAPYLRLLRRLRGRTKAAATTGLLRSRTGHQRLLGPGAAGSLPSVLRPCAFGAAPLLRAALVPLPAPGSVSALSGTTVLSGGIAFLSFGPCPRLSCPCRDGRESPWRLLNPCTPGVTSGSFPGATPPKERRLGPGSPQGLPPALTGPSRGTSSEGRVSPTQRGLSLSSKVISP